MTFYAPELQYEDKIFYVVFKGSKIVHQLFGFDFDSEKCPNCGVAINGVILGNDGRECWKDKNSIWKDHAKNLRFIKKPSVKGYYRFCKSK